MPYLKYGDMAMIWRLRSTFWFAPLDRPCGVRVELFDVGFHQAIIAHVSRWSMVTDWTGQYNPHARITLSRLANGVCHHD